MGIEIFKNNVSNVIATIGGIVTELNKALTFFAENIQPIRKYLNEFVPKVIKFMEDLNLSFVIITNVLDKYDWWSIPFSDLAISDLMILISEVVKLPYDEGKQRLDSLILDLYRRDNYSKLENIVKIWQLPYFERRRQIFLDALEAHKNFKYTLSIPTLACQIEGILWEWSWDNCPEDKKGKINKVRNFFNESLQYKEEFIEEIREYLQDQQDDLGNFLKYPAFEVEKQYQLYRINLFFKSPGLGTVLPSDYEKCSLNRNLIAHGLFLNFNQSSEINSLKLFLLLDLLNEIVTDYGQSTKNA